MANPKTLKKRRRERLKHLKQLYETEPEKLTFSELQELKEAGIDIIKE